MGGTPPPAPFPCQLFNMSAIISGTPGALYAEEEENAEASEQVPSSDAICPSQALHHHLPTQPAGTTESPYVLCI